MQLILWLNGISLWYVLEKPGIQAFTLLFIIGFGLGIIIALIHNQNSNNSLNFPKQDSHHALFESLKSRNQQ
ncbi:hypothetical protein CEN39_22685 [Fischerella thermalis CCMEE 5201]|jgi:hypothetical protein|nr:hypothetical protein CEN39_22685 [Fischerella thermalis CCMEE 5201]